MKITFEQEGVNFFAISQDIVHKGYLYDEVMWAEIEDKGTYFIVRWEDDYATKHHANSRKHAEDYILREYHKHTFQQNGSKHFLG